MAVTNRPAVPSLEELIRTEGHRFSFYQLVRLLLRQREGTVPPGEGGPPGRETVRFRPALSMGFAARDMADFEIFEVPGAEIPVRYRVTINFFGLYGPASPLPNHFTEDLLWGGPESDLVRDFLDLFHHRLISFLWRSWTKYRYDVQFAVGGSDPFTRRMLCLVGLGTKGMKEGADLMGPMLLRGAGMLSAYPRSASRLRGFLRNQFEGIEVQIEQFRYRRVRILPEQLLRLGRPTAALGQNAALGERFGDVAGAFRITLGPLGADDYRRFLPGQPDYAKLVGLTRLFPTDPLDFDVELRLRAPEVPALTLSAESGLPLGQMSWLSPTGKAEGRAVLSTKRFDPLGDDRGTSPQTVRRTA